MFPDGSGLGSIDPYEGTYTIGGVAVGEAPGQAPGPAAGPATPGPMFPDGLAAPVAAADGSGLPPWILNPEAYVPSPEAEDRVFRLAGQGAPTSFDPAAVAAATGPAPQGLDLNLSAAPSATALDEAEEAEVNDERSMVLYGTGIPLSLSAKAAADGLIHKVICKTGTLALSPGPGQIDLDVPLELTDQDFDDMVEGYREKAFPYVTIPETHANGALENTGYVKALESLSKDELMADDRIAVEGKAHVVDDPEDTRYLLAGLGFTDAEAKRKAQEGSVPDVSVGIKSGYRHKRSGKTFRRALEHVALTPIPWVDGLIPFAPAMVLSAMPTGATRAPLGEDPEHPGMAFDGAFTETTNLAMEVRMRGDDFDASATRAALMALQPGDELSWNWDVNVTRLAADGEDKAYFLIRAPESDSPDDYGSSAPALYSGVDSAMSAVTAGVAVCQQRKANQRARDAEYRARSLGPDAPVMAKYAADAEAEGDLDLAVFEEDKHPRLHGKFVKSGHVLKDKPGSMYKVKKVDAEGVHVAQLRTAPGQEKHRPSDSEFGGEGFKIPHDKLESTFAGHAETEQKAADDKASKAGPLAHTPTSKADDKANEIARIEKRLADMPQGNENRTPEQIAEATRLRARRAELRKPGGAVKPAEVSQPAWDKMTETERATWMRTRGKRNPRNLPSGGAHVSTSGRGLSAEGAEDDTLSLSGAPGSLVIDNPGDTGMPPEITPTHTSVEALLAQHQATIEALQAQLAEKDTQLSAVTSTVEAQGATLHVDTVGKEIRGLVGKLPPSVLLAAQTVMLKDESWKSGAPEGLNLSVQSAKAGSTELEDRTLQTPTDIVRFMLSAMPTADGGGNAALQLAAINEGLGDLSLSAHADTNDEASREANATAAVDEWERKAHPERFDGDGKKKIAA